MKSHSHEPRSRRRWLQFGFATLLKLTAVAALFMAWWTDREELKKQIDEGDTERAMMLEIIDGESGGGEGWDTAFDVASTIVVPPGWAGAFPPMGANGFAPGWITPGGAPPGYPMAGGLGGIGLVGGIPSGVSMAAKVDDRTVQVQLFHLFATHQAWLKKFPEDLAWQELAAQGRVDAALRGVLNAGEGFAGEPIFVSPSGGTGGNEAAPAKQPAKKPAANLDLAKYTPAVSRLLTQGSVTARQQTSGTLTSCGQWAKHVAPALAMATNDTDATVRYNASYCLQSLGPADAAAAAPRLKRLLATSGARDPLLVAVTLSRVDPKADVLPPLLKLLKDAKTQSQQRVLILGYLSSLSRQRGAAAVPTLRKLLGDKDNAVRAAAAGALIALADREEAKAILTDAFKREKDKSMRRYFARLAMRLRSGPPE